MCVEEILLIFHAILKNKEETIMDAVNKFKEILQDLDNVDNREAIAEIIDEYLADMEKLMIDIRQTLAEYKNTLGLSEEKLSIKSYDEMMSMTVAELSLAYGLEKKYEEYILDVGSNETNKQWSDIRVADIASIPLHAFRVEKIEEKKMGNDLNNFFAWLKNELNCRKGVK